MNPMLETLIDGHRADDLYVPVVTPTEALPLVVIKIQNTVDKSSVRRLVKYDGPIIDHYHVVSTICINTTRTDANVTIV
ncbi:hypothetical protein BDF21DRAFT_466389 [Thamnidium elegans]|uniref:Uncharacterized protein n=1 Tax=Thamnidium elegans TaxID=101142 RepID=A0A8H7SZW0_9FUNG|nr:hypothetical protein INT48_009000 [Thamnidium elegans]KAI8066177.1 hypothetical protein BDF21DRAFT_466389 [Thamnidium elegans]